jgi:hypothetical protein
MAWNSQPTLPSWHQIQRYSGEFVVLKNDLDAARNSVGAMKLSMKFSAGHCMRFRDTIQPDL